MKYLAYFFGFGFLFSCATGENGVDAYGNFEVNEIIISSQVGGEVIQIGFEEGNRIEVGQVLVLVDTTALYLQKKQVLASISALKQKLQDIPTQLSVYYERKNNLEKEVLRIGNLLEKGAASQKQFDDLKGELDVVNSQINALKSQLSTANRGLLAEIEPLQWRVRQLDHQLSLCMIKSPARATVLNSFIEKGEMTAPGKPLLKIANLEQMTLKIYVSGNQLSQIKLGQNVKVFADGVTETAGRISRISSKAEFTPKTIQTKEERISQVYAVDVAVSNPDGVFKIGMPGEVKFN